MDQPRQTPRQPGSRFTRATSKPMSSTKSKKYANSGEQISPKVSAPADRASQRGVKPPPSGTNRQTPLGNPNKKSLQTQSPRADETLPRRTFRRTSTKGYRLGRSAPIAKDKGRAHPILEILGRRIGAGKNRLGIRLGAVLAVTAVALAVIGPPTFTAVSQYNDYLTLQRQISAAKAKNQDLKNKLERWDDPDYVAAQARTRLGYALAGERQYVVTDPGTQYRQDNQAKKNPDPVKPWFMIIADSTVEAGLAKPEDQAVVPSIKPEEEPRG